MKWHGDYRAILGLLVMAVLCLSHTIQAQVLDTTVVQALEKPGYVEYDLNNSLPKRESLFKRVLMPENYDDWKEDIYRETTIKLSASYQGIAMHASSVLADPDYAAAGSFLFEAEWTPLNFGKNFQGGLTFSYNNLHTYGNASAPPFFLFNTGSAFANDALYLDIGGFVANLYWEQWFKKDRFFIRIGQHVPSSIIDFSRFADVRTSVSNPAIGLAAQNIPFGPPALGITAKLLPGKPRGFYFLAHLSDVNSVVNELDWGNIFETGDVFVAGEIGHNWGRLGDAGPELDHLHLLVFGASRPSKKLFPSESGWGFKVAGEKQFGKWVTLANYTYNTASGGGFGFTGLQHVINVGGAYTKPLGIKGEAFLAFTWAQELDEGQCGAVPCSGRNQSMMEAYWKILVFPQFWITPGMQMHFDPVNNPDSSFVWLPMMKFRVFF